MGDQARVLQGRNSTAFVRQTATGRGNEATTLRAGERAVEEVLKIASA